MIDTTELFEQAYRRAPELRGVVEALPEQGLIDLADLHVLAPNEFSMAPRVWFHTVHKGHDMHAREGVHGQILADRLGAMDYVGGTVSSLMAPMFRERATLVLSAPAEPLSGA